MDVITRSLLRLNLRPVPELATLFIHHLMKTYAARYVLTAVQRDTWVKYQKLSLCSEYVNEYLMTCGRLDLLEFLRQVQENIRSRVEGRSIVEQHGATRRKIHKIEDPHNPRRLRQT